jgi:ubiquinol-cytochrome c reductase cytochrome c subunit
MRSRTIGCTLAFVLIGCGSVRAGLQARTVPGVVQTSGSAAPAQTPGSADAAAPTGNIDNGKRVYVRYGCYQCHGRLGQGAPSTGPRLGPAPMALASFARYVRQPRGEMPPYTAKVVTDRELADMHAYLRSVPRPPAIASLPFDR